ncbi:MAG: phage tail protein [Sulfitobacter sp.]
MFKFNQIAALAAPIALAAGLTAPGQAAAGTDAYIGEILLVGYTFCPRTTTEAAGQLLPISQNQALFSLYGTTYGGDGRTTFALPDLRGRAPIGQGNGPGLTNRQLGVKTGTETVTLNVTQMPQHKHSAHGTNEAADKHGPGTDMLAAPYDAETNAKINIYHDGPANKTFDPAMIGNTGGNLPHPNMQPSLALRYCVALQGIYPSRN